MLRGELVCETVVIDTCDDQCYETTTYAEVTMDSGNTCEDTDLYGKFFFGD